MVRLFKLHNFVSRYTTAMKAAKEAGTIFVMKKHEDQEDLEAFDVSIESRKNESKEAFKSAEAHCSILFTDSAGTEEFTESSAEFRRAE